MKRLLLMAIFILQFVSAQNFVDALRLSESDILLNARTLGMGNAVMTFGDNYSASLINPANLGLNTRSSVNFGMGTFNHNSEITFFNRLTKSDDNTLNFNNIGAVMAFPVVRGSFVISFGYNRIKDFSRIIKFDGFNSQNNSKIQTLLNGNRKDDLTMLFDLGLTYEVKDNNGKYLYDATKINGKLTQKGTIKDEGNIGSYNFGGAVEVSKDFFVGLGFNIYSGEYTKTNDYFELDDKDYYPAGLLLDDTEPKTNDFRSFNLRDNLKWDISGWDFKLGFLFRTEDGLKFGATVKFPTKFTIEDTYSVSGETSFANSQVMRKQINFDMMEYKIKTPYEFSLGGSYEIENLKIGTSAEFIDYKQMEFTEGLNAEDISYNNSDIKELFRMVTNFNAGAEYTFSNGLSLRGGFIYKRSPYKDDPSSYDKKYITAGLGYKLNKRISIDAAYSYGWWENFGDNYGSGVSRTYQKLNRSNLLFAINYAF